MACGCRNKGELTASSTGLTMVYPTYDDNGMVALVAWPDCTTPYTGAFQRSSIYIVAYGTDTERLYRRADRTAAIADARATDSTISQVPASSLCHDAVVELLGS